MLTSRTDYFRASRPGRGHALDRANRDDVWQLTERLAKRLEDKGLWTWRQIAATAARAETERAADSTMSGYRYRHVVVDEA